MNTRSQKIMGLLNLPKHETTRGLEPEDRNKVLGALGDNGVSSLDTIDDEVDVDPYADSGSSYALSEDGSSSSTSVVSDSTNGENDSLVMALGFDNETASVQNAQISSSSELNVSDTVEKQPSITYNLEHAVSNEGTLNEAFTMSTTSVSNNTETSVHETLDTEERPNDHVFVGTAAIINGKRGRDKVHACFFCNKLFCNNFARHIEVKHSNEIQVARILAMPKKSKERREAFAVLIRSGDFFHNCSVLSQKSGELILTRRPSIFELRNVTYSDFGPCPECLGFMMKRHIWHHLKYKCTEKISKLEACSVGGDTGLKGAIAESSALLNGILGKTYSSGFIPHIINKFRDDDVSNACKNDDTIMRFGAFLYEKYGVTQSELIRQSMRQLGRLKLELINQGETFGNISEVLVPGKFDAIVTATKVVCVSTTDDVTKRPEFKTPSLALKLGYAIKKCASIERGQALRLGDLNKNKKHLSFLHLMNLEWSVRISSNALATLYSRKKNASDLLPVTSDLVKLTNFLEKEIKEISKDVTAANYSKLLSMVLSRIILFNKRRSGEAAKMTLNQYASRPDWEHSGTEEMKNSLTPFENKLASSLTIVKITGKRGRIVPILLTKDMKTSLDQVVVNRVKGGILSENPYVFAIPNTPMSHVRGHDCLRKWCTEAELLSPESITSTQLRKYISTVCQVFDLTENEYDWLARHLGHDIRVHREFYRLQENAVELTKVSRLLLAVEQGEASKFSGKTLKDINIEDLDGLNDEDNDNATPEPDDDLIEEEKDSDEHYEGITSEAKMGPKSKPAKKKFASRKNPWSKEEKTILLEKFDLYVKKNNLPGKDACSRLMEKYPIFANRKWTDLKFFIKNHISSLKRRSGKTS